MILNLNIKYMIATCEYNIGAIIPEKNRYLGESDQTCYEPLKIGKPYIVYGLLFISDRIDFLVDPNEQGPFWAPSFLFSLKENGIPNEWKIRITNTNEDYKTLFTSLKISCIIGYPSLTNDYQHYVGLAEGNPNEVKRFIIENSIYKTNLLNE